MTGRDGEDVIIRVPVGTVVRDAETGKLIADIVAHAPEVPGSQGRAGREG